MKKLAEVVWGGMVADAASMGFHWLYDQSRIAQAGGNEPEFKLPDHTLYQLNMQQDSTFVHAGKQIGDNTQYGDQLMVMLRSLAQNGGQLSQAIYEDEFARFFGAGGPYVGYIDRPTEVLLYNLKKRERDAYARARAFDNGLTEAEKGVLEDEVMVMFKFYNEALSLSENMAMLDRWILIKQKYHRDDEKDRQRSEYCRHMFKVVSESKRTLCGDKGDDQFPAVVKLPPVVAIYRQQDNFAAMVERATRLTNNNDISVQYAQVYAAMLATAIETGSREAVIDAARQASTASIRQAIDTALGMVDQPNVDVADYFGLSCHLPYGLPQNVHLIATCDNYVAAIRKNIVAAGDNAGRAIMLGAIFAALYGIGTENGVPQAWIDKLTLKQEIADLLEALQPG